MKPVFIDIHCHLDSCKDVEGCVRRAEEKGVGIIVTHGTGPASNRSALKLAKKYKSVKAALGIYPIEALALSDEEIEAEIEFIRKNEEKIFAIGEVGIDFKEDEKNRERQKEIFRKFVALSIDLDKAIIVHSRKAEEECIEILEEMKAKKVIMHCFCGKKKLVQRAIKNGWFLTIPTNVKHSQQFQENAALCPLEQLFCETDSPYLHPEKLRDNEPVNVVESYKKIAEIKKISVDDVKRKLNVSFHTLL